MNQICLEACEVCQADFILRRRGQKTCGIKCSKKRWTDGFKSSGYKPRRQVLTSEQLRKVLAEKYNLTL